MKFAHRIRVLGRELQLRSDTPPELVREVEALVNASVAEASRLTRGGDQQVLAIVALMNMAESLLSKSREDDSLRQHVERRIAELIDRIDGATAEAVSCGEIDHIEGLDRRGDQE